ncbi:MAG: hypothetical protein K2X27_15920 [Candidatus Obscuribacterales bacterium]|nr:hypothetical protein [Candidatus Obscuribacterales bacterium]
MAVVNQSDDVLTHPQASDKLTGARLLSVQVPISIAVADDDGSKYLVAELPDTAILESITLEAAAITGGTSYSLGIFNVDGSSISKDAALASALDMSSISGLPVGPTGAGIRQAMTAVAITDVGKKLFELAGHVSKPLPGSGETLKKTKYRIVLTATTVGSAAATIIARIRYLMAA